MAEGAKLAAGAKLAVCTTDPDIVDFLQAYYSPLKTWHTN